MQAVIAVNHQKLREVPIRLVATWATRIHNTHIPLITGYFVFAEESSKDRSTICTSLRSLVTSDLTASRQPTVFGSRPKSS